MDSGADPTPPPQGDPWMVLSYLIAGVILYGVAGWLIDRWLGTTFVVGIGIVFGASLGIYLTIMRVTRAESRYRKSIDKLSKSNDEEKQ